MKFTLTSIETEHLRHWLALIIRSEGVTAWEHGFCASLIAQAQCGPLRLTHKQRAIARQLVNNFQDTNLIERD